MQKLLRYCRLLSQRGEVLQSSVGMRALCVTLSCHLYTTHAPNPPTHEWFYCQTGSFFQGIYSTDVTGNLWDSYLINENKLRMTTPGCLMMQTGLSVILCLLLSPPRQGKIHCQTSVKPSLEQPDCYLVILSSLL